MPLAAIDSFTPLCTEPEDFDAFWSSTLDSAAEIDPKPFLARQKPPAPGLTYDQLTYTSLDHIGISGYLLSHDVSEPRPVIVHSHGYNSQYDVMLNWANSGCHVLGIDFRGFGRSEHMTMARGGYVLTGISDPYTSILRGVVADLVQAIRVTRTILDWRMSSLTLYGFSFGGAAALMASAFEKSADLVVAGQPTLGWHNERLRMSTAGSSAELNGYLADNPADKESVMRTLSYFDTLHFASRIETPTFIGIGLDDAVVPSRSVIAITNLVATPQLEVRILPVSHSDDPRESLWGEFDAEWLEFSRHGLPGEFGSTTRQLRAIEGGKSQQRVDGNSAATG